MLFKVEYSDRDGFRNVRIVSADSSQAAAAEVRKVKAAFAPIQILSIERQTGGNVQRSAYRSKP